MADNQEKNIIVGESGWSKGVYLFIFLLIFIFFYRLLSSHPPTLKVGQTYQLKYTFHYPLTSGFWYKNIYIQPPKDISPLPIKVGYNYQLGVYIDSVLNKGVYETKYKGFLVNVSTERKTKFTFFWRELNRLNSKFSEKIDDLFPWPTSALMKGLIFGQKTDLRGYKPKFLKTGTIHIVAASGFNVMLVFGIFFYLFILFLPRKYALVGTLVFIWLYALLISFQPPVLRAATMASLLILSQLLRQPANSGYIFLLTILFLLIFNPSLIFSLSFQLSVFSTLGLIVLAKHLVNFFHFLPAIIREDVGVTFAAQIFTWPLIGFYFSHWNLITFLTNAFILWTIPPLTIGGAALLFYYLLPWHPLFHIFSFLLWLLANYLFKIIEFTSHFDWLTVRQKLNYPLLLGYYLFLFIFLRLINKRIPSPLSPERDYQKGAILLFSLPFFLTLLTTPLLPQNEVRISFQPNFKAVSLYSHHQRIIILSKLNRGYYPFFSQLLYPWERKIDLLALPESQQKNFLITDLRHKYTLHQVITLNQDYLSQDYFLQLVNKDGNLIIKTPKLRLFWALTTVSNPYQMLESNLIIAPPSQLKLFSSVGSRDVLLIPSSTTIFKRIRLLELGT